MKNIFLTILVMTALSIFASSSACAAVCTFSHIETITDPNGSTREMEVEGITLNINDTIGNRRSMFSNYMYTVKETAGKISIVFQSKDKPYPVVAAVSGPADSEIPVSIFGPSAGRLVGMRCKS